MYIKRVELCNFKSFGGKTAVPLLKGFTVISGPNGSGKSNILDALLFALGLAGSKGMRADRLPDLVNHSHNSRGRSTVEASVSVTFDLEGAELEEDADQALLDSALPEFELDSEGDEATIVETSVTNPDNGTTPTKPELLTNQSEWTITRKLRVTSQGAYTSTYYFNGQPCTLTELHEQLHRLRIYPEGYNVVLQGDVTSIISMNPRERREIIDELAGVGAFDRKIHQAKHKLDAVKEREDQFRIVEGELIIQRDRLAQDRVKAQKYQKLRQELAEKSQWEVVIRYHQAIKAYQQLETKIRSDEQNSLDLTAQLETLASQIQQSSVTLENLNQRVKAMGEEEQLALQAKLATREAELRQLQRQEQELASASQKSVASLQQTQTEIKTLGKELENLAEEEARTIQQGGQLRGDRDQARQALAESRDAASQIAATSEAWVQEQTDLHHQVDALVKTLEPLRAEQIRLQERIVQLQQQAEAQTQQLQILDQDLAISQNQLQANTHQHEAARIAVQTLGETVASLDQQLQVQQQTQSRLLQEQRDKQRKLDRLEAQAQAMQESQGTGAAKLILQSGVSGVCGLVAQLGRVDPRYQLALETAAGGRLGNLVVEDDEVAAAGIELLKQRRAGRITFLPLNKLARARGLGAKSNSPGLIDYALNLVECDPRYRDVFAYVFGNTVVFASLMEARRCLGQYRIVTLEGELLETSGAMTGGSGDTRYSLHFGKAEAAESSEAMGLRERLQEIQSVLERCDRELSTLTTSLKQQQQSFAEARQQEREQHLQLKQLQTERARLTQQQITTHAQLSQNIQEQADIQIRLDELATELPAADQQLDQWRQQLAVLEESQTYSQWQAIQSTLRTQETLLQERELAVRSLEQQLRDLTNQQQRSQEKLQQAQQRLQTIRQQQTEQLNQTTVLATQKSDLTTDIDQIREALSKLEQTLSTAKQNRDRIERQLREQQGTQQQVDWQRQKLQEALQSNRASLVELAEKLQAEQAELPDPLPEIPDEKRDLDILQHELRSLQKRIQGMEPVNMLALEEYERTQERLQELSQKLAILDEERTELLLRIENFTTLRQRAFKEAFDAVNQNFQILFAELSDGDGHLQLDDPNDPFSSGLNLIAHPKGKPVQRLASMSGGEKSLTALSFIFALQRYRPSPFYAFDEVDMFLDGANVERLAKMIRQQAQQAQFIVVSLRRPMIEAAERTIGVTQARGAFTQVLGISLQSASASV